MATGTQSCSVSSIATKPESCRCGQGARKKESSITSCDNFKKRCKCFQKLKGCTDNCQCLGCENPYGKKVKTEYKSDSSETSKRKRRPQEMTTESMSGKHFLLKRPCLKNVSRWTLLEELALFQIAPSSLTAGDSDIDIDVIAMQYLQLVDNSGIHPKS